jgi:uncharacterized protein
MVVVLAGVWLWRLNHPADRDPKVNKPPASPEPLDMVCCTLCGVHVPSAEVVQGKNGPYCSVEHRQRAEP